ncbi:ABC transporter substrate-binding protein [Verticiella sediminum]|nr:ABC transporter substrate-binding protein [Verticiella sediminum]
MKDSISRRNVLKAASALTLTALATGNWQRAFAADRDTLKVVFPTTETTYQLPYLVAKDTGWFDEHGLDVEELFVNGDAVAMRSVLSKAADVTLVGPPTVFQAYANGAKLKYIGSTQPRVDYQILGSPGIGSVQDLSNRSFASAAPSDMTTEVPRLVIQKHGGDGNKVRFLQVGGHSARLQALEAGKVDGTMVNTLTSVIGQRGGKVKVLSKVAEEFPDMGYVLYTGLSDVLDDPARARALTTFMQGNIYGARLVQNDPDTAARILAKRVPDLSADILSQVIKELNSNNVWGLDGGLDESMISFTADILLKWQMIPAAVTPDAIVDRRFVDEALAALKPA